MSRHHPGFAAHIGWFVSHNSALKYFVKAWILTISVVAAFYPRPKESPIHRRVHIKHIHGVANLPYFGSRNPCECQNTSCQVCKFIEDMEESSDDVLVVRDSQPFHPSRDRNVLSSILLSLCACLRLLTTIRSQSSSTLLRDLLHWSTTQP